MSASPLLAPLSCPPASRPRTPHPNPQPTTTPRAPPPLPPLPALGQAMPSGELLAASEAQNSAGFAFVAPSPLPGSSAGAPTPPPERTLDNETGRWTDLP